MDKMVNKEHTFTKIIVESVKFPFGHSIHICQLISSTFAQTQQTDPEESSK